MALNEDPTVKFLQVLVEAHTAYPDFAFAARSFIDAAHGVLKETGGSGHGTSDATSMRCEIGGADPQEAKDLAQAFSDSLRRHKVDHVLRIVDADESTLDGCAIEAAESLRDSPVKLTRALFFSLPEGAFVVSNLLGPSGPLFDEAAGNLVQRKAQWQRIKDARCDQRLCRIRNPGNYHQGTAPLDR